MRSPSLSLFGLLMAACGATTSPPPSAPFPATTVVHAAAPPDAGVAHPDVVSAPSVDIHVAPPAPAPATARAAYEAALAAYGAADRAGYLAAFADTLRCVDAAKDVPRERLADGFADLRPASEIPFGIDVLADGPDGAATLLVRTVWWQSLGEANRVAKRPLEENSAEASRAGIRERLVRVERVAGALRVVALASRGQPSCIADTLPKHGQGLAASPVVTKCLKAAEACMAACDRTCSDAGNSCNSCPWPCVDGLATCVGITDRGESPLTDPQPPAHP